ncbi:MAG: hypothetical protein ABSA72_06690 [Nitrososphaerales archaeon]
MGSAPLSRYISRRSLSTGRRSEPARRYRARAVSTVSPDELDASTLVFWPRDAARARAPWTTKCSPVMITFPGASATTFRTAHPKATEG